MGVQPVVLKNFDPEEPSDHPTEVDSRLSAKKMIVVLRLQMMDKSLLFSTLQCPDGRLELGLTFWGFQRSNGEFDWIWVDIEGQSPILVF